jgi:L-fuculose-phosphate aldolase
MNSIDLTEKKVIALRDLEAAAGEGATEIVLCDRSILTPSARDFVQRRDLRLSYPGNSNAASGEPCNCPCGNSGSCAAAKPKDSKPSGSSAGKNISVERLFFSPEAEAIKAEIVNVGRKLWQRMYVDGNGGNISYRLGPNAVICTPTLLSKADLTPKDLCLVDLEGNQLAGPGKRTSEIYLHLEIYKTVPEAKAAVHCHPPHATAYAITGRVPPTCVIPEHEVFVGKVAYAPYETPGTQKFAETIRPFAKQHNTILLGNHGIICWADTVTHAEWYAEVLDTYCWTLIEATKLGAPICYIPQEKATDLMNIKKRLGLPDVRHDLQECQLCDMPELPGGISLAPNSCTSSESMISSGDIEAIVKGVTDAVLSALSNPAKS